MKIIFIIFFCLFSIIYANIYYASPDSIETNAAICINHFTPCNFSTLIELNDDELIIFFIKGVNSNLFNGNYVRNYPISKIVLNSSAEVQFDSKFSIWFKQKISYFEANNFNLNSIEMHPHNETINNISHLFYFDTEEVTNITISINNLSSNCGNNSETLLRISGNYSSQIYLDSLNVIYNSSKSETGSLIDQTIDNNIGSNCNITIVNSNILNFKSYLFSNNIRLNELIISNSTIRFQNTLIQIEHINEIQSSEIKIYNSILEGRDYVFNLTSHLSKIEIENSSLSFSGILIQLEQNIPFYFMIKNSKFSDISKNCLIENYNSNPMFITIQDSKLLGNSSISFKTQGELNSNFINVYATISLSFISEYGSLNIKKSHFENSNRGLYIIFTSKELLSSLLIEFTIFKNIISNSFISGNLIERLGGSIHIQSQFILIKDNIFENCQFYTNNLFLDLNAKFGIIGIYSIFNTEILIYNNIFNNTRADIGGAIALWYETESNIPSFIKNNSFISNRAIVGSAIAIYPLNLFNFVISNNSITNNIFEQKSALYIFSKNSLINLKIHRNSFLNNKQLNISSELSDISIEGFNIENIESSNNLFESNLLNGLNIKTNNCKNYTFVEDIKLKTNFYLYNIICLENFNFYFDHIEFNSNINIQSGDNLYDQLVLKNTVIFNDIKLKFPLNLKHCHLIINKSIITDQIKLDNVKLEMYDSNINNLFNTKAEGGGIRLNSKNLTSIIKNSRFNNLYANYGGCIYIENGNLELIDSIFDSCRSKIGGGLYIASNNTVNFNNVTFSKNYASIIGGGIFIPYYDYNLNTSYNNGQINFDNCYGLLADNIGSNPIKLELHEKTVKYINTLDRNDKYVVFKVETPYGPMKLDYSYDYLILIYYFKLFIKYNNMGHGSIINCPSDIKKFGDNLICIKYGLFSNEDDKIYNAVLKISSFTVEGKELFAYYNLEIKGSFFNNIFIYLSLAFIISCIFFIICCISIILILLLFIIYNRIKKNKIKILESKLFRIQTEQDLTIENLNKLYQNTNEEKKDILELEEIDKKSI